MMQFSSPRAERERASHHLRLDVVIQMHCTPRKGGLRHGWTATDPFLRASLCDFWCFLAYTYYATR